MDSTEILLGKDRHKLGVNEDNFIGVEMQSYEKSLPYTEETYYVDSYQRYYKEKDGSNKHRLAFTIAPFCSNVLFNVVTEPVYKEGADDCVAIRKMPSSLPDFSGYKSDTSLNEEKLVRDTGYSHPYTNRNEYPIEYHCGLDIFNNHHLRKKDFNVVNPSSSSTRDENFNTIRDFLKDRNGVVVREPILMKKNELVSSSADTISIHLYQNDNILSFKEAVTDKLMEYNGWFGFLNPATIPVNNAVASGGIHNGEPYSINKCMNNNSAWEQIDMYPDRTLYSFIPKYNKFRGRMERNWDYCITYPYSYDSGHTIVNGGLRCVLVTNIKNRTVEENEEVTFKSAVRHNLHTGEYVNLIFGISGSQGTKTANPAKILSTGLNGKDNEHYFTVEYSSIQNEIEMLGGNTGEIRFRKVEDGNEAEYYIRKFKKIDEKDFANSLNKLSFAQNGYSDQVAQIVYTEDIDVTELRDNHNRPLSELYLTIVKRNAGHTEWYSGNVTSSKVEFSHCFGEVISGFDLPSDDEFKNYNVRRIHSVNDSRAMITPSPDPLESNIAIENEEFFGDICEFFPGIAKETSIEPVYHRFNTAQREISSGDFSSFTYDEIIHDDYDIGHTWMAEGRSSAKSGNTYGYSAITQGEPANIIPEGYYYKPHYRIPIREFENTVNQGYHYSVSYERRQRISDDTWKFVTSDDYYFESGLTAPDGTKVKDGSIVYAYKMGDEGVEKMVSGTCIAVEGNDFRTVTIKFNGSVDLSNGTWRIFKHNTEMPDYAYDLKDGTGRYVWREVMSFADMTSENELYDDVFTNGAHYHHVNVMFYLRRQDPTGEFGIGNEPAWASEFMLISGKTKEDYVSYAEYVNEGEGTIC